MISLDAIAERTCRADQCPEVQRSGDDDSRLRALLARLAEHLPADHPLLDEIHAALN